jgi:hypothetical protein
MQKKHRQLDAPERGICNDDDPIGVGLAPGNTIHYGSLEFIIDHLGRLHLSPQGWDSNAIFIGMAHSMSLSQRTALEESSCEDVATSGTEGSLGSFGPRGCNVVTLTDPIIDAQVPEGTPVVQTIPIVTVRMAAPQPGMELLPDQQQAYQEEQPA